MASCLNKVAILQVDEFSHYKELSGKASVYLFTLASLVLLVFINILNSYIKKPNKFRYLI